MKSKLFLIVFALFSFFKTNAQLNFHFDPVAFSGSNTEIIGTSRLTSTFSFSADIKVDDSDQWRHLIELGAQEFNWYCPFRLEVGEEGQWYVAVGDGEDYIDAEVSGQWKYGEWVKVLFTYENGVAKLYENGNLIKKFSSPLDVTSKSGTLILGSNKGESRFFQGVIKNAQLVSAVITPNTLFHFQSSSGFELSKGKVLANVSLKDLQSHTIHFEVKPLETINSWGNILHFGSNDDQRLPAIWFYPGQTRLHYRQATNIGTNTGFDPGFQLAKNKWTTVTITWEVMPSDTHIKIYFDGVLKLQESKKLKPLIDYDTPIFASSPWVTPAKALLRQLIIFDKQLTEEEIQTIN
ncbi:LamG domain-containing protein [Ekhidna sp.]|uniref:LamG domain-containing protein n=1 Tax=Ekhidna sp. TaxID=2608089 RepID=UPI00329795D7